MRGINLGLLLFLSLALSFSPRPGKARVTVQDYGNSSRFYLTSCRSTLVSPWPFEYELVNDTSQNSSIIASGHFVSSNAPSHLINGSIVFRWNEVIGVSVFLPGELLKLQRLGAKAVVLSTNFPNPGRSAWKLRERYKHLEDFRTEIRIPVLQVVDDECGKLNKALSKNDSLQVLGLVDGEDCGNVFLDSARSIPSYLFQASLLIDSLAVLSVCIWRLTLIVRKHGCEKSLPQVILIILIPCALLQLLYAIDPFGMRELYDPFSLMFLYTPHFTICLGCTLVVLLHWNNALQNFGAKSILWTKKYIYGLCGFIALAEIVFSTLRGFEFSIAFLLLIPILYLLIQSAVICYVLYTAVGLFKFLKENLDRKTITAIKVLRMTRLFLAYSGFLFPMVILTILGATQFFQTSNERQMICWGIVNFLLSSEAICIALMFSPKDDRDGFEESKNSSQESGKIDTASTTKNSRSLVSSFFSSGSPEDGPTNFQDPDRLGSMGESTESEVTVTEEAMGHFRAQSNFDLPADV